MNRVSVLTTTAAIVLLAATLAAGQLKTPTDWKWRFDGLGKVVESEPKANEMQFVAMPPGWHVTTGPAVLLYHPEYQAKGGNFAVEAEIFLFPGESQEEYGVFLGGKNLAPSERPSYVAFVARRDGMGAIRRGTGEPIVAWKANEAIAPNAGKEAVKNVLRVEAGAKEIVFSANGKEVARIPREATNLDGHFGFRFGKDVNVHASRLDVTFKLAPVPVK
jgi:hypothetical protein